MECPCGQSSIYVSDYNLHTLQRGHCGESPDIRVKLRYWLGKEYRTTVSVGSQDLPVAIVVIVCVELDAAPAGPSV